MKPKRILWKDDTKSWRFKQAISERRNTFQSLIDEYNKIGYPPVANGKEIAMMYRNPEEFMYMKATDGGLKIRGNHDSHIEVAHSVAKTLINYLPGSAEFIDSVKRLQQQLRNVISEGGEVVPTLIEKRFTIKNGEVAFTEFAETELEAAGVVGIYTEKGERIYQFIEQISAALEDPQLRSDLSIGYATHEDSKRGKIAGDGLFHALQSVLYGVVGGKPIVKTSEGIFGVRPTFDK